MVAPPELHVLVTGCGGEDMPCTRRIPAQGLLDGRADVHRPQAHRLGPARAGRPAAAG